MVLALRGVIVFDCRSGLNSCRIHGIIRAGASRQASPTSTRPAPGGPTCPLNGAAVLVGVSVSGLVVSGFRRMGDRFGSL